MPCQVMTKPYDRFIKSLQESRLCAWIVSEYLLKKGFDVRIIPATTTPNEEERFDHVDTGDIEIRLRAEVKHWPNIDFTSIDTVPYDKIIVDETYKIKKYGAATLYGYFILNASKTACLFIPGRTRSSWIEEEAHDKVEGGTRNFTFCPKDLVRFYWIKKV